jgi:hypothetical protein
MRSRISELFMRLAPLGLGAVVLTVSGCVVGTLPVPAPNDVNPSVPQANAAAREAVVLQQLQLVTRGEGLYAMNNGKYGTFEELIAAGHMTRMPDGFKYIVTLTLSPDAQAYTITATPQLYGPDGQRSFFVDQTGVIRGANHGGSPASAADPPAQDLMGN